MLRHTLPFLAALALPALALAGPGGGPCKADAQRLCADQLGDRDAVKTCLETHRADLSEACQTKLERKADRKAERQAAKAAVQAACAADRERLCPDAEPGKASHKCMRRNADQLSEGCAAAIDQAWAGKGKRGGHGWQGDGPRGEHGKRGKGGKGGKHMRACKADAERLCPEHKGDRKAMKACLTERAAELSPDCAAARARKAERKGEREGRRGPPAE